MLHRLLFVAGMTVGAMTPLIWSAYVARPDSRAADAPTAQVVKAAHGPVSAATEDVTSAISPAPAAMSAPKVSKQNALTPPKPNASPHTVTGTPPSYRIATARADRARHRAADRYIPAVVDDYNGAHIIIVCAALTVNEQLRAGCP